MQKNYLGANIAKLGFGLMRLPMLGEEIDLEQVKAMVDQFMGKGFTYFDTAYVYHGGLSEVMAREALVKRYPRESFQLATKLPIWEAKEKADLQKILDTSLERAGVEYFDFYLLHNMGHNVFEKCRRYDAFHFMQRKKAEGKIRFVGMSFHDVPELLKEILAQYGECLDFLQLQINYLDWEQPNIQARRCLEVANQYHIPVIAMEPCKGGTLVNVPKEAEDLMKAYNPDASVASWALRFAASQEGVFRVLSGMNSLNQVEDNAATFSDFKPLSAEEYAVIAKVTGIINANTAVGCTACGYCTHGCPESIAIPEYFSLYNSIMRTTGSFSSQMVYYNNIAIFNGKAGDCIGCGKCEQACPQHLPIREHLKDVVEKFEKNSIIPTRR